METVQTLDFDDPADFLSAMMPWQSRTSKPGYIYRGHKNDSFGLVPVALRASAYEDLCRASEISPPIQKQREWSSWQIALEESALNKFFKRADRRGLYLPDVGILRRGLNDIFHLQIRGREQDQYWIREEFLELAGLAQHYGIPTRLLDWSYDPLIAAFFASEVDPQAEFFSVWSLYMEGVDLYGSFDQLSFVTPFYGGNPNLAAQAGLFTHWRLRRPSSKNEAMEIYTRGAELVDRSPLDKILADRSVLKGHPENPLFRRLRSPAKNAPAVRSYLRQLGYTHSRVFPGYRGVVEEIMTEIREA